MKPRNEILADIVKRSGKTQEEFANSLGLKKAAFNNYIKGRRDIPNSLMEALMEKYKINPAVFFEESAPLYISDYDKGKLEKEGKLDLLAGVFLKLNNDNQDEVLHFAQFKLDEQEVTKNEIDKNEEFMNDLSAFIDEFGQDAYEDLYKFIINKRKKNDDNADAV